MILLRKNWLKIKSIKNLQFQIRFSNLKAKKNGKFGSLIIKLEF